MNSSYKRRLFQAVVAPVIACVAVSFALSTRVCLAWQVGTPIVNYWENDNNNPSTDLQAQQMAEVGINLVWAHDPSIMAVAAKWPPGTVFHSLL